MAPPATVRSSTSKGEETRAQILAAAVQQASASGFESLTIGTLADKTGLSKSGLFAHFGSREELQIAAVDEAARQFSEIVFLPALKVPRGLRRLTSIFENWLSWPRQAGLPGGCPLDAANKEYTHRPGAMREAVLERHRSLSRELIKAVQMAIDTGELRADTDAADVTFGMFGIILACFHTESFIGTELAQKRARTAFERLIGHYLAAPARG
jgi:AcrR family transcriptional regulator